MLKKISNSLADQFRDHTIRKYYLAIVDGAVKKEEGVIRKSIEKGHFEEGQKVRIAEDDDDASESQTGIGKRAETHWRVVERYEKSSLLRLEIKTGRTHQIRIHMSDEGYPLVGDKLLSANIETMLNGPVPKEMQLSTGQKIKQMKYVSYQFNNVAML